VDTTKAITHISLCSGYEGIGLGLRRVLPNLREIAFVEREGFPVANLVAKMEAGELDSAPVFTDVKQFPYGKFRGQVDILSGGFPCQPFSCAGQRKATDDPRHLFPYIRDGIRDCQPRIVFLENVGGIISAKTADGESVLKYVLRELEGLGYRATAGVFSAEEVGAPHQRKRVFILGMANSEDIGRGGRTHRHGDDGSGLQEQEAQEQPNLRKLRDAVETHEEGKNWATPQTFDQQCSDSRETGTDQSGEERGNEPQGASSLSQYGSQSQGSQELADPNNGGGNQDRQPTELRSRWD
jgi:DNA-cytosine methyltransferase